MKILHICTDEKFIDSAIDQFVFFENITSVFYIYSKTDKPLYVKNRSSNILFFKDRNELIAAANAQTVDFVVLHSLCLSYTSLLQIKHRLIWFSWGYDVYSDKNSYEKKLIPLSLFKPQTKKCIYNKRKILKNKIKRLLALLGIKTERQANYDKLTSKIDYIATPFFEEFKLIKDRARIFVPFSYGPVKQFNFYNDATITPSQECTCGLLGNSLDPTNNHIDVLQKLESFQRELSIIIPISYSGTSLYKEQLKNYISTLKHLKCNTLESFIDRNTYFQFLSQCQFSIFGHIRQQATGNISQMLYIGSKVFLYKDSIGYKHYKSLGYHIYTIENDLTSDFIKIPLSQQEIENNREIALKEYDSDAYLKTIKSFFDTLDMNTKEPVNLS